MKAIKVEVEKYKTFDGKIFNSKVEAMEYEKSSVNKVKDNLYILDKMCQDCESCVTCPFYEYAPFTNEHYCLITSNVFTWGRKDKLNE